MKQTAYNLKYCPACSDFHDCDEFGMDARRSDGLTIYCKKVYRERQRQLRLRARQHDQRTAGDVLPLQRVDPTILGDEDC